MERFLFQNFQGISRRNTKLAVQVAGVIVVAGILKLAGVASLLIVCAVGAGLVIILAIKRWQSRKTEVIFQFYVAANEILGDVERRIYHFEMADVIRSGEKVVQSMPDPPPLSSFALGALYHSIGEYGAAAGHLALAAEEEVLRESPHVSPSRQLRRYVERLRRIERRPKRWPKVSAAIKNLERMHEEKAAYLLAQSQVELKRLVEAYEDGAMEEPSPQPSGLKISSNRPLRSVKPPPPISEVLNDVYQEETS